MPGSGDERGRSGAPQRPGRETIPVGSPREQAALRLPASAGFDDFDQRFADTLLRLEPEKSPELAMAAALASHATRNGQVCVSLADYAGREWSLLGSGMRAEPVEAEARGRDERARACAPDLARWLEVLRGAQMVGEPGEFKPLVLDDEGRLYLHRYWICENRLTTWLRERTEIDSPAAEAIAESLSAIEARGMKLAAGQRRAVATALLRPLSIIAGGAGTGKTTIIACILRLLAEHAESEMRVRVAAPTGKAANRLAEQLKNARTEIDPDDRISAILDAEPTTLHRLLGSSPDGVRFRHDARNPLPLDVLVVDESSMVDLALMWKLVRAMPPESRLVLVGDPEQLPPVEVGTVFGELSGAGMRFTEEGAAMLAAASATDVAPGGSAPLADCVVTLDETFRFTDESGIGELAAALRTSDAERALAVLAEDRSDLAVVSTVALEARGTEGEVGAQGAEEKAEAQDIEGKAEADDAGPSGGSDSREALLAAVADGYAPMLDAVRAGGTPQQVLDAMNRFRVLAVHREGEDGVEGLNAAIEDHLARRHGLRRRGTWYAGRMVMVTRNLHTLRLFNGDVGIALPDEEGRIQVWFDTGGEPRGVAPGRLSNVETVFAMTVHKSQGSEYEHALVVLPRHGSRLLSRELLYTAATRARDRLTIAGPQARIREGLDRQLPRSSALAERLLSEPPGLIP